MNKQEHRRTLSIGLILIRGLLSVSMGMMHNSLNIFGKTVITRLDHVISLALSSSYKLYELLVTDVDGIYHISERGQLFLENDPQTVREIDEAEGILQLLTILATKSQAKRSDLLPEWGDYLHAHSKFGTELTIKDTLRRRLVNVVERATCSAYGQRIYD